MGWLTDRLNQFAKIDPLGSALGKAQMKYDSKVVREVAGGLGMTGLEREAQANVDDPMRGIGRAATATALAYAAWLGYGAVGGGGAAGTGAGAAGGAAGSTAGSAAAYGSLALNAYGAVSSRNAGKATPQAREATYMPNPNDPAAQMARRRKADEIRKRSGRASTILSDQDQPLG
jgi:hypothetical protein